MRSTVLSAKARRTERVPASGSAAAAANRNSLRFMVSLSVSGSGFRRAPGWRRDIGDDLAERSGIARRAEIVAGCLLQGQQREDQLSKAIAFLEMRIARENE